MYKALNPPDNTQAFIIDSQNLQINSDAYFNQPPLLLAVLTPTKSYL
jgi:hypothetical protein